MSLNFGGINIGGTSDGGGSAGLSVTNLVGLCFWLDGDCNTRGGLDRTKKYFENLMWIPPNTQTLGNAEVWNSTNTSEWNSSHPNMLNIGTNAIFPDMFCSKTMTLEAVLMFTDTPVTYTNLISTNTSRGFNFAAFAEGANLGIITDAEGQLNWDTSTALTWKDANNNIVHYICATLDIDNSITTIRQDMNNVVQVSMENIRTRNDVRNSGVFGKLTTNATDLGTAQNSNISIGMIRAWTRVLSEDEISRNYKDAKKRFGCI